MPPPVLVTVVVVSFSVASSIACSVPVLVTGSPVMSSSPPLASSVPELVEGHDRGGSIVSTPPVASIRLVLVMPTSVMALVPVEIERAVVASVPPVMVASFSFSVGAVVDRESPPELATST